MRSLARTVRIGTLLAALAAAAPGGMAHASLHHAKKDATAPAAPRSDVAMMVRPGMFAAAPLTVDLPTDLPTDLLATATGTAPCEGCTTQHAQFGSGQSISDRSDVVSAGFQAYHAYDLTQDSGPVATRSVNLAILALGTAWLMLMWRRGHSLRQAGPMQTAARPHAAGGR